VPTAGSLPPAIRFAAGAVAELAVAAAAVELAAAVEAAAGTVEVVVENKPLMNGNSVKRRENRLDSNKNGGNK